jgi:DNA-binding NarL/FixJ family response regulator
VVAEARDGDTALQCLQEHKPDVAVLDIEMPKKDGFEVVRAIQTQQPDLAVVFLTMHKNEALFNAAVDLGVQGYVLKDSALAEIVESVRAVAAGHSLDTRRKGSDNPNHDESGAAEVAAKASTALLKTRLATLASRIAWTRADSPESTCLHRYRIYRPAPCCRVLGRWLAEGISRYGYDDTG